MIPSRPTVSRQNVAALVGTLLLLSCLLPLLLLLFVVRTLQLLVTRWHVRSLVSVQAITRWNLLHTANDTPTREIASSVYSRNMELNFLAIGLLNREAAPIYWAHNIHGITVSGGWAFKKKQTNKVDSHLYQTCLWHSTIFRCCFSRLDHNRHLPEQYRVHTHRQKCSWRCAVFAHMNRWKRSKEQTNWRTQQQEW